MSQNHPHDNIYSILGKLEALKPTPQEKHDATVKQIYESVEAQGSILKGLRNIDPIETRLTKMYEDYASMGTGMGGGGVVGEDPMGDVEGSGVAESRGIKRRDAAVVNVAKLLMSRGIGWGGFSQREYRTEIGKALNELRYPEDDIIYMMNYDKDFFNDVYDELDKLDRPAKPGVAEGWGVDSGDYVTLKDEPCAYWDGSGRLSNEYKELFAKLVPGSGPAKTIEGEVLRAVSKIYYRHYNDGDEFNQASFDQLQKFIGTVSSYDELAEKATEFALKANGNYHPNQGWDCLDVMEYGPPESEDDDYDDEDEDGMYEGEQVPVKGGTVHKGTYGTSYGDDESPKAKHVPRAGVKGRRPNAEKPEVAPKFDSPKGDIFGRTTGTVPAGKAGKVVKGKGHDDRSRNHALDAAFAADDKQVDEVLTKKTPASTFVKDFQKSKDPKFAGKSKAQRTKQALGAYYGMHPEKINKTESRRISESVNFRKMMDEADMTMEEMLECLNQDIKSYKATGDVSERLRDFMHLHGHMKKQMEENKPVPYEIPAVQRKAAGAAPLTPSGVQAQDAARSMHPGMTKLDAPAPARNELDELAKLAGIKVADEGNEFSGKLAQARAAHADTFDVDGKEYKVKEDAVAVNTPKGNPVNGPKEQYMSMKASTLNPGEGDNGEKAQHPDKPTFKNGDNPLARPAANESVVKLEARLAQEYESIKKSK